MPRFNPLETRVVGGHPRSRVFVGLPAPTLGGPPPGWASVCIMGEVSDGMGDVIVTERMAAGGEQPIAVPGLAPAGDASAGASPSSARIPISDV